MLNLSDLYFAYFDWWFQAVSGQQVKFNLALCQNCFEPSTLHSDPEVVRQCSNDGCQYYLFHFGLVSGGFFLGRFLLLQKIASIFLYFLSWRRKYQFKFKQQTFIMWLAQQGSPKRAKNEDIKSRLCPQRPQGPIPKHRHRQI